MSARWRPEVASALAWPAYVLALSQYRYVQAGHSSTLQFHAWEIRNYTFFDTAVVCAVFLLAASAVQRLVRPSPASDSRGAVPDR